MSRYFWDVFENIELGASLIVDALEATSARGASGRIVPNDACQKQLARLLQHREILTLTRSRRIIQPMDL